MTKKRDLLLGHRDLIMLKVGNLHKLLCFWVPIRKWWKAFRQIILDFHPIRDYCHRQRIKQYLEKKANRGKARVVVYTAISGGYDTLRTHQYLCDDWDYVCFSDTPIEGFHAWDIRPMVAFDHHQNVRKAKYYKLFPDTLFPGYEYSIWIDGKVDVVGPSLERNVKRLIDQKTFVMGVSRHPIRNCIYDEAKECIRKHKDDPNVIEGQIAFLKQNKYPTKAGLFEMTIMLRKHRDLKLKMVMQDWWDIIMHYSFRDQLSFCYVAWKNNLKINSLFSEKKSVSYHEDFVIRTHQK